jgi:tRNA modification GTPase
MNISDTDSIAAIATPAGEGAIAIVRLSGGNAFEIADRLFRGHIKLGKARGFTVHHGLILSPDGGTIDEVLATVFRSPHSYTGEDSVEFGCHGGMLVTEAVLDAVLRNGARPAQPGEFSKRAFLNGKMDLSQAEAVADLIAARSERARAASVQQLEGKLSQKVKALRTSLTELCALLEIDLDFSEEGLNVISRGEIEERIIDVHTLLRAMLESYEAGKIARDGVLVVLVGRPNAGKSSLFNALLKERRAIVTSMPGTTRDTLEEAISIGGVLFRLVDTAGLREAADQAEKEGVSRTFQQAEAADIILLVEDVTHNVDATEIDSALKILLKNQHLIVAMNKSDLVLVEPDLGQYDAFFRRGARIVKVSAKTGEGLDNLRRMLFDAVTSGKIQTGQDVVLTSKRHQAVMMKAAEALSAAMETHRSGRSNEFIALDVREALSTLGEVTGDVTSEEILNNVFSRFCIGK